MRVPDGVLRPDARDAQGNRKGLIELRPVKDTDGATDNVWHFVRGRAYELAQKYFACGGNATAASAAERAWDGLPLMGLPEAGRGAHWETRILRDDVMSYGFNWAISSITLAALEDLGFYLADYSKADCMQWGRMQGCGFVTSRCGKAVHDQSASLSVAAPTRCAGPSWWRAYADNYLGAKCQFGFDPCTENSGYSSTGPVCDQQCVSDPDAPGDSTCSTPPSEELESASDGVFEDLQGQMTSVQWEAWLIPCVWLLGLFCLVHTLQSRVCPRFSARSRKFALAMASAGFVLGLAGLGGTVYLYMYSATFGIFVEVNTIYIMLAYFTIHVFYCLAMLGALCFMIPLALTTGFWFLLVLVLLEVAGVFLIIYWIYSLGAVPLDALGAVLGEHLGSGVRDSTTGVLRTVLAEPVALAEGYVCKAYQLCCRDVRLDRFEKVDNTTKAIVDAEMGSGVVLVAAESASGTDAGSGAVRNIYSTGSAAANVTSSHCLSAQQHSGADTDLELTLTDPSTDNFCAYTSGARAGMLLSPPAATCELLGTVAAGDGFELAACQASFCQTGIDGYLQFLNMVVSIIQRYAIPLGACLAGLVLLQLVFACNLRRVAEIARHRREKKKVKEQYYAKEAPLTVERL